MVQIHRREAAASIATETRIASFISSPADLEWFETMPGERVAICVHSSRVGGRYSVLESRAAPGSRTPLHYHKEDEVFHVLDGVLSLAFGGKLIEAGPGTTVVVPGGTAHAWENRSELTVRMLITLFPGGLEDLLPRLTGVSPDQMNAVARSYGTVIIPAAGEVEQPLWTSGRPRAMTQTTLVSGAMWP